jgi:hypothetical protein
MHIRRCAKYLMGTAPAGPDAPQQARAICFEACSFTHVTASTSVQSQRLRQLQMVARQNRHVPNVTAEVPPTQMFEWMRLDLRGPI